MNQKGYIAILSMIIVGVVSTTLVFSFLLFTAGSIKRTLDLGSLYKAQAFADACAEEALELINNNPNFIGSDTLFFDEGECRYEIIDLGGEKRRIKSQGQSRSSLRRVDILIDKITPRIKLSNWEEVSDF